MEAVRNWPSNPQKPSRRLRGGFTLVELLVVIVIIAILIGLVLPAISGVRARAREAEVKNDIAKLEQAITAFKVEFGIDPPSQISLFAAPADWNLPANTRSMNLIRQIWPRFDFSDCGGASNGTVFAVPGGGTPNRFDLNGAECLVFFLGGMIDQQSGAFTGFAKDPANPFTSRAIITNRQGPYFEFVGALRIPASATAGDGNWSGRLTDRDADWLPEYRDTLPQQAMPYVYFSAASGNYRTAPTTAGMAISMSNPWVNTDNRDASNSAYTLMNYAYYVSFSPFTSPAMSAPHKPKGFQIISPGSDGIYGTGGLFNPENTSALSRDDRDNITNFHAGRLAN
ncbi:MAG: hypothetical protein FD138_805 [Planctomycetota bacterium]|nr:MAG: hypothetical protein FD138_805 [Planctomycetota bacterium]